MGQFGENFTVDGLADADVGAHDLLAAETRALLAEPPEARPRVFFTRPAPTERLGIDFDVAGRRDAAAFADLRLGADTEAYVCGPAGCMDEIRDALLALGLPPGQIHTEAPGAARAAHAPAPQLPADPPTSGGEVVFGRSSLAVRFDDRWRSPLELADACDVPVDSPCRTGVCHRCATGLVAGAVAYEPQPLDLPRAGFVLRCCARPDGDVALGA
jgi:hypothetical protein